MPIYDYECRDCGAEVGDVFQKVTDPELTTCPKCNKEGLFRLVTGGLNTSYGIASRHETVESASNQSKQPLFITFRACR